MCARWCELCGLFGVYCCGSLEVLHKCNSNFVLNRNIRNVAYKVLQGGCWRINRAENKKKIDKFCRFRLNNYLCALTLRIVRCAICGKIRELYNFIQIHLLKTNAYGQKSCTINGCNSGLGMRQRIRTRSACIRYSDR